MNYFLFILFGFLPSIIWLLFYLRKDAHPEPKTMVLKVFFFGMLIALPTALIEVLLFRGFNWLDFSPALITGLNIFIAVAFIEEFMKYAVVNQKVIRNKEFDEPVDAMIYMIIVALGFAAVENLLILFSLTGYFEIFKTSGIRFIGATFLHALCSATLGYFIALWFFRKKSLGFVVLGLLIAVMCHGLYNFSLVAIHSGFKFAVPIVVLASLAIFVSWAFIDLKRNFAKPGQ